MKVKAVEQMWELERNKNMPLLDDYIQWAHLCLLGGASLENLAGCHNNFGYFLVVSHFG